MADCRSLLTAWLTALAIAGAVPVSAQAPASQSESPPDEALVSDPADPEGSPPPPAPISEADNDEASAETAEARAPADPAEDGADTSVPSAEPERDQPTDDDDGYLTTSPNKDRRNDRRAPRRARDDRRSGGDEGALPSPDALSSIDLWATAGVVAGCTLCGGVPVLVGAALIGFGALLISASLQAGGCGAIVGVLFGIVVAILGIFPMSIVGLTSTAGTLAGGTLARLMRDENVLPTVLGPLLGVVPAVLAIAILLGGGSLVSSLASAGTGTTSPDWLLPALGGVAAAALLLSFLAGPIAVAGGVGAIALWPAFTSPAPAEPPPASDRRASARRLLVAADDVQMAF